MLKKIADGYDKLADRALFMTGKDLIVSALGNRLYYSSKPIKDKNEIVSICKKFRCDGLFYLNHNELLYFDNNGSANFCVNAVRSIARIFDVPLKAFFVEIGNEKTLFVSYKQLEGDRVLFSTQIKILKFEKLNEEQFKAYVGNNQLITVVGSLDFDIEEKVKQLSEAFGNSINYAFLEPDGNNKHSASVRVYEENVGETLSCGSSAVAITKVLNYLFNGDKFELRYRGGRFRTFIMGDYVEIAGNCELEEVAKDG